MSGTIKGLCVGMALVWTLTASAVESTNRAVKQEAPAVAATNTVSPLQLLQEQERATDAKIGEVMGKVSLLTLPVQEATRRTLAQDEELNAMQREIAAKQQAMEKRLAEKYPDISAKLKERQELAKEYSTLVTQLRAIRKKMDQLEAAKPVSAK